MFMRVHARCAHHLRPPASREDASRLLAGGLPGPAASVEVGDRHVGAHWPHYRWSGSGCSRVQIGARNHLDLEFAWAAA